MGYGAKQRTRNDAEQDWRRAMRVPCRAFAATQAEATRGRARRLAADCLIVAEHPPAPGRLHAGDDGLAIEEVLVGGEVRHRILLLTNEILE